MLKCNGEEGECECDDGSICKWKGSDPTNDNCPCGAGKKMKRNIDESRDSL